MKVKNCLMLLCVFAAVSCLSRDPPLFIHEPDYSIFDFSRTQYFGNVIETENGAVSVLTPAWLESYAAGGIDEIEKLDPYSDKYAFVAHLEGEIFSILEKWRDNFTILYDFPLLAAERIQRRMLLNAYLYPDDEYGLFYETLVKSAYNEEYPGAIKEDTAWVRTIKYVNGELKTVYIFLIFISIDKTSMQSIIRNMMAKTLSSVNVTNAQSNTINRLRNNFFEGF